MIMFPKYSQTKANGHVLHKNETNSYARHTYAKENEEEPTYHVLRKNEEHICLMHIKKKRQLKIVAHATRKFPLMLTKVSN